MCCAQYPPPQPTPTPPSLLLPDRPQYCHCLQCRRSTRGSRLPLSSTVRPLPVATRRLLSSTPTPPPLNLPSEVPIGIIERDECSVPNNSPSSVVIATRSSSGGSGPILVLSSSLSLAAADDKRFPHPLLDTADCNVFFMSTSTRSPHKCCPPSTVKDQHPDTATSSPLPSHGCHCRSHQRIPH